MFKHKITRFLIVGIHIFVDLKAVAATLQSLWGFAAHYSEARCRQVMEAYAYREKYIVNSIDLKKY